MGTVSVCRYKRTVTPFFAEQAGLNLYSMEELAYFLYHNISLVDRQFFDERLCRWLREEAGCAELAVRLQSGMSSGSSLQNLVLAAVGASGMYTDRELSALGDRIKGLTGLQEQERLKLQGDELLQNRNEWMAMEVYRRILKMHQNSRLGMEFYGAVWNNLGVCYVRQFLFKEAADCFETSYEYDPREETKEQAELAAQLEEGIFPGAGKKRPETADPQKLLLQWEREYRVCQKP